MFEVPDTHALPYSAISYIVTQWPNGSATRASGVVVGVNDVLTALHAVYDTSRGGWAAEVTIYPGADTVPFLSTPFGSYGTVGSIVGRAVNWDLDGDGLLTAQESQGDLALLGLSTRIGNATGWLPITDMPGDFTGVMAGYPARGTGLMAEDVFANAQGPVGVYDVMSGLGPGASGGPLLYTQGGVTSVVGVLSAGDVGETTSTYAGLFGAGTWDWLNNAIAANDVLIGLPPGSAPANSPNIYLGTASADSYLGSSGRDSFMGMGGNDTFDGSDGIDTAVFSGTQSTHTITQLQNGELVVSDKFAGRDGVDTLLNVERLRFDDVTVAFDVNGHAGEAYRLYQAAFDRVPDLGGLGFQTNELDTHLSLAQVAANFIASPEFQSKYGTSLADSAFVSLLYAHVLHRTPQQFEVDYHVNNELHAGYSRADVLTFFSESPENQANVIGQISGGIVFVPVA